MISILKVEQDLAKALKAKDKVVVDVIRGLKTRIQNETISKGKDLEEVELIAIVKSEIKKRKEAKEAYEKGGREELAKKEAQEIERLNKYLPPQLSEQELSKVVEEALAKHSFTVQDFGRAMGLLKKQVGQSADGALLAKVLKEKLK